MSGAKRLWEWKGIRESEIPKINLYHSRQTSFPISEEGARSRKLKTCRRESLCRHKHQSKWIQNQRFTRPEDKNDSESEGKRIEYLLLRVFKQLFHLSCIPAVNNAQCLCSWSFILGNTSHNNKLENTRSRKPRNGMKGVEMRKSFSHKSVKCKAVPMPNCSENAFKTALYNTKKNKSDSDQSFKKKLEIRFIFSAVSGSISNSFCDEERHSPIPWFDRCGVFLFVAAKPHYDRELVTWFSRERAFPITRYMRFVVLFRALNGTRRSRNHIFFIRWKWHEICSKFQKSIGFMGVPPREPLWKVGQTRRRTAKMSHPCTNFKASAIQGNCCLID